MQHRMINVMFLSFSFEFAAIAVAPHLAEDAAGDPQAAADGRRRRRRDVDPRPRREQAQAA